ncbi:hypothetical protein EDM56_23220 [Brevibacillus fluminis]|uniref:Uncharacterized protein n=1 Tax=Brevibacillus fluminis TaxID=511487 RepID=A0A3M8D471_9BACL|nr:hypothetical protein [Brevibacillus fluminis]RNB82812.1 hypothetical protein EDM56_23220 [Brevibacillus fluminis]
MTKLKVFLICLSVMVFVFSAIACVETYSLERSLARGVYTDLMDDMQDIGYLDSSLTAYYRGKMQDWGWTGAGADFFAGSYPMSETTRARKERAENVSLTLSIHPSKLSQWMNLLVEGEATFRFAGTRPSEYFDQGW